MGLPKITFNIAKNGLGLATGAVQKIPGIVLTGVTVTGTDKVVVNTSYQIFSLQEAINLGVDATNNAFAYNQIKAFYQEAGTGSELWFMLIEQSTTLTNACDINNDFVNKLLNDSKGKIRTWGIVKKSTTGETITEGLDADVHTAVTKAQELNEDFATHYYPVRCVIGGNQYSGTVADLKNYKQSNYNTVAILIANVDAGKEASIGLLMGRLAKVPTQRKISRVLDAAVEPFAAYFSNGVAVEQSINAWDAIHDKGYIFLRSYANRSGYYFTSDVTLTADSDDFNSLARGLVMDEAVLVTYDTLLDGISDEIPVTPEGLVHPAIIKGWQNKVERNIDQLMTQQGKLSAFKAYINPEQNVLQTNSVNVTLQLLPVGYADYITVNIGFTTKIE